ncbi:hypothetical protein Tco_0965113 [Tanacetum coccineum]
MVAYLLKPEGSKDFQQIVDFLNTSHLKFALTKNATIYTSLIQQFWQTASTSILEDGEVEITATLDGQLKTITEASLRRHLKLEDADGISSLPNTEFFKQLTLIGVQFSRVKDQQSQLSPITHLSLLHPPYNHDFHHPPSLEQDLKQTKKVYGNAYTKLIMRVKKLENKVKLRQPRRSARVVISDTEEDLVDPSKQRKRIDEIDQNPSISLVQDEGTSWI